MRVDLVSIFVVSLAAGALACRDTPVAIAPLPDAAASTAASTSASATVAVLTVPEAGPPRDASTARDAAATVDSGGHVLLAPTPSASGFGKHNDVCAFGGRSGPHFDTPLPCGPGLFCCYPCGIAGCDSVCHTQDECNADRQRP